MATGIPLPGLPMDSFAQGMAGGSSMMNNLISNKLNYLKMQQQQKQFEEAQKRMGANSDLQRALLQQQIQHLKNQDDPMFKINQMKNMMGMFGGQGEQGSMPTELMGQGMGVFSPEGLASAQQQNDQGQENGINYDALKQNPILRGFFKQQFGFDPLATNKEDALHGPARDASDLEKLRLEVGENSPVYQNAKSAYDAQNEQKKDLSNLRARTMAGLKPGEKEFFDPETGQPIGKEIPLTEKERESEQGNVLFNELYPYVYNGASPFSGEGSIGRLENAAANYKNDPQARKLFDDFLLAEKMLAATTVNEASTLKAGRTNRTYNMLKESLDSQDIPSVIKKLVKQYQIPASAQLKASMRYQQLLSDARKKARANTPATQKLFYNPEMQAKHTADKEEGSVDNANTVIVIDPNGKRFKTTAANAANLPKGWKRG